MAKKIEAAQANAPVPKDALTYTRMSCYEVCPRLEYYQYGVAGRGVESTTPYLPFIEGDFGHYAVAMFYKTGRMLRANLLKRADRVVAEVQRDMVVTPEDMEDIRLSFAMMTGAASGYRDTYAPDLDRYDVLFVEQEFEFKLGDFTIQGKIDRGLREKKTGDTMVWETKWVGGITRGSYEALPMSFQDLIYCEGFKALTGEYPKLRCRDFIQKSRLRLKADKSGGKESFLQYEARIQQQYQEEKDKMFWRPQAQLVLPTMIKNVTGNMIKMLENRERVKEDPYMSFACLGMYGQPCKFVQACEAKLLNHEDGWNAPECRGMYRLKKVLHPELQKDKED